MIEGTNRLTLSDYEKIFRSLYKPLCLFANRYVNDLDFSEDIVQEVFVKTWEKGLDFDSFDKAKGFFYIAVKNASLSFLRTQYSKLVKAHPHESLEILQTESYFIKETIIIEAATEIEKAIKALSPKCGMVMELSFKGLTNPEIAEEMKISVLTVKKHKKIAYKTFRETLAHLRFN